MPQIIQHDASGARRVGVFLAGVFVLGIGVACAIQAHVGVAPYDVLYTGLSKEFGIPLGVASMLLAAAFMGLGAALGGRIGPGSLIDVLCLGPWLAAVLALLPDVEAMAPRIAFLVVGFTLIVLGVTATIIADIGQGPVEILMLALHGRGYALARARTGIELTTVAIGWLLHGEIGVATVAFGLLIGPALRICLGWVGFGPTEAAEASDRAAPGV